jgi:hypothetical protein
MKKTLALLAASTALSAAIGLPAWSAMHDPAGPADRPITAVFDGGTANPPLVLASDDDDDDRHRRRSGHGHDDDDEDDDDDDDGDECDDEDDGACGGGRNPAPAGTVAPPRNGLFGNGAPPQVQVK